MFKKHALRIDVVKKTPEGDTTTPQAPALSPEEINKIAKDQIQAIAVGVGAVLLTGFLAATTKEVVVHTAKTKIK